MPVAVTSGEEITRVQLVAKMVWQSIDEQLQQLMTGNMDSVEWIKSYQSGKAEVDEQKRRDVHGKSVVDQVAKEARALHPGWAESEPWQSQKRTAEHGGGVGLPRQQCKNNSKIARMSWLRSNCEGSSWLRCAKKFRMRQQNNQTLSMLERWC